MINFVFSSFETAKCLKVGRNKIAYGKILNQGDTAYCILFIGVYHKGQLIKAMAFRTKEKVPAGSLVPFEVDIDLPKEVDELTFVIAVGGSYNIPTSVRDIKFTDRREFTISMCSKPATMTNILIPIAIAVIGAGVGYYVYEKWIR